MMLVCVLDPLFFLLILLLAVTDFDSTNITKNDGGTKKFFLIFPQEKYEEKDKEVNDGSHHLFLCLSI